MTNPVGEVYFSNYSTAWRPPSDSYGHELIGWCNELGVTAPAGVGLFCKRHLAKARRLRHLESQEAVRRLDAREESRPWLRRWRRSP